MECELLYVPLCCLDNFYSLFQSKHNNSEVVRLQFSIAHYKIQDWDEDLTVILRQFLQTVGCNDNRQYNKTP